MPLVIEVASVEVDEYDFGSDDLWDTPQTEVEFTIHNDTASAVVITDIFLPVGYSIKLDQEPLYNLDADESTELTIIAENGMAGNFIGDLEIVNTSGTPSIVCLLKHTVAQTGPTVVYTSRARMESAFGRETIRNWADKSGRRKLVDVQRTIDYYIYQRSRMMDTELTSGKVTVPFEVPIPETICDLCTKMAATDMYAACGIFNEEMDKRLHSIQKNYRLTMNRIRSGGLIVGEESMPIPFSWELEDE